MTKLEMIGFMYVLAVWITALIIALLVITVAMMHDGKILLDFNRYGEAWMEALGLLWALMLTPWAFVQIKNARLRQEIIDDG